MISGCSAPNEKRQEVAFDSVARIVDHQLKTNADSALKTTELLRNMAVGIDDPARLIELRRLRGQAFQVAGNTDSAYGCYVKMQKGAWQMKDTLLMLQACNILGTLLVQNGPPDSAENWYRSGMTLAKLSGNRSYQAGFAANLGLCYSQKGQRDSAMQCYADAARYYENIKDSGNIAQVYRNLAGLCNDQGNYKKAIFYYRQAISINRNLGNEIEAGIDLNNLAVAFMMMDSDSARFYYLEAMQIMSKQGTVLNLLPVQFNYANYLMKIGHPAEAEKIYQEVLTISKRNNVLKGQMFSLNQLARIAAKHKEAGKANELFREAITIALKNQQTADLLLLYREAFEGNRELQNYNLANAYFTSWEKLNDSLKTNQQRESILKYQAQYETYVLETRINDLNNKVKLHKSRTLIIALISLTLILLTTTVAFIFLHLHRQAKQRVAFAEQRNFQAEQEKQLKEIAVQKITLEKLVQEEQLEQLELKIQLREQDLIYQTLLRTDLANLNRSIQEKLRPFYLQFSRKKDQEDFLQAIQEIARDTSKDPLADFEMMFRQMHGTFFEKLLTVCPLLSKSEMQVAAMVRLNLASKDIARLVNVAPATIETTRHHIRKKLGIEQNVSLTAFLITI